MPFDAEEYLQRLREDLRNDGFDVDKLSDAQVEMIQEPNEAPENYACDGEITPKEMLEGWTNRLEELGLNREQISLAIKTQL